MTFQVGNPGNPKGNPGSKIRPRRGPDVGDQWKKRAACREEDRELFFNESSLDYVSQCYCRDCPVRKQCNDYANYWHALGTWAGRYRRSLDQLKVFPLIEYNE